jgi:CRISPR-associated protein (TIGR03984 family)
MSQTDFKDNQFFKTCTIQGKEVVAEPLSVEKVFQFAVQSLLDQNKDMVSEKCFVVAFFDHQVVIGTYLDKAFSFHNATSLDDQYLNQIRIFNHFGELYLWKDEDKKWQYRIRTDERIEEESSDFKKSQIMLARQYLWGTQNNKQGNWLFLDEKRGMKIILPEIAGINKDDRIILISYYYIGYDETTHQAGYVDCRFVDFKKEG